MCDQPGCQPPSIHPSAIVESDSVGCRTRVWAFAHVMSGSRVGADCNIGDGVFIESGAKVGDRVIVKNNALIWYGVTLEDDVFIGPNAVFTNDPRPRVTHKTTEEDWVATVVRRGASVGANATVLCGIEIGANAMVGAGSVVTRDVPPHALVYGNPARVRGWVCECTGPLDRDGRCRGCGQVSRLPLGV